MAGTLLLCREWGSCPWLSELDGRPHRATVLVCLWLEHIFPFLQIHFLTLLTGLAMTELENLLHMMQDGHCNTAVGARRVVHIGDQRMFERLVAVDDEDHLVYVQLSHCLGIRHA